MVKTCEIPPDAIQWILIIYLHSNIMFIYTLSYPCGASKWCDSGEAQHKAGFEKP